MPSPEICTVVLSYRNERTVLDAVDSLLGQDVPIEVVVSHSGGGDTPRMLASRPGVKVVSSDDRRLPGAARNAGMAVTDAPLVSFLAADCVAAPGWAAARLRRHSDGALAVASALRPFRDTAPARAMWLVEHGGRVPLPEPGTGGLHGLSYTRELLQEHGPFPEDRLIGEDTHVNDRIQAAGVEIEWAPEVVALHRYPESLWPALAQSFDRGTRVGGAHLPTSRLRRAYGVASGPPRGALRALPSRSQVSPVQLGATLPLMVACSVAKFAGVVVTSPAGTNGNGRYPT